MMQCASYSLQLEEKQRRVVETLSGVGAEICPIIASPLTLGYRNKAKLIARSSSGRAILGSYAPRSHEVIDMAGCQVTEPPLDRIARTFATLVAELDISVYDEAA